MATRALEWTGLEGSAGLEQTMAGGSASCRLTITPPADEGGKSGGKKKKTRKGGKTRAKD
jgi:hypothetical protein